MTTDPLAVAIRALEFYADKVRHSQVHNIKGTNVSDVMLDNGTMARKALEQIERMKTETPKERLDRVEQQLKDRGYEDVKF